MTAVTITDLNNGKTDLDHIGDFSNSPNLTVTDRLGHVKKSLAGITDDIETFIADNAQPIIDAATHAATATAGAATATSQAAAAAASATAAASSQTGVAALATTLYNARVVATWTALSAISGLATGVPGEVTTDPGTTHTDPVTAATVANEGLYSYVSGTGWKWIAERGTAALEAAASDLADEVATPDDGNTYLVITADGETILGIENTTEELFGTAVDNLGKRPYETWRDIPLRLATAPTKYTDATGWNHVIFGGQSNSVGSADGDAPISTSQPYSNLTFDGGVRANGTTFSWSATKALIEEIPAGSASSETPCSGATEFANNYAARKHGIPTASFVQFASVAALGATALSALDKPSATYTQLLNHVTQAKARATTAGVSYNCQAVCFIEGETDAAGSTTRTTYSGLLTTMISDLNTDILAIKAPTDPVHLLIAQPSYGAAETIASNIALAHYDVIAANALAHLSHPTYFLPFDSDDTHRTVVGHKLEGAYFGRAWAQLLLEGRKPDCLWPLGGFAYGTELRIRFRVPTYPLKLDISTLQKATDFGIKVVDDTGTLTLSEFVVEGGDTIVCTLNRSLGTNPRLRLGIDYLAWDLDVGGAGIFNGAMTNIRDSSADTIVISGTTYPMYHWCPHYEGGISVLVS